MEGQISIPQREVAEALHRVLGHIADASSGPTENSGIVELFVSHVSISEAIWGTWFCQVNISRFLFWLSDHDFG